MTTPESSYIHLCVRPCLVGSVLLSCIGGLSAEAKATDTYPRGKAQSGLRPNIILFMVDDMGWQDTSYPFASDTTALNRRYHTPNMERLARQGVAFTSAYASSVSSPSRVSLLTGMNAARHRVTNWTLHRDKSSDIESSTLRFPDWHLNGITQTSGIPHTTEVTSLVELLRSRGYHTIHVGKAHWGAIDTPGEDPHHLGFEVNIAGHAAGGLASYLGEQRFGHSPDGKPWSAMSTPHLERYWGQRIFATEALTLEAISALGRARRLGQPFFLHMSHYALHIPIDRDERYVDKYLARGLSSKESAYASLIEGMDKSLGDLMDWLEANNLVENTAILFVSDNGGLSSSAYWRDEPLHTHNAPLNSGKGSAYEGGVRVPMIVSYPAIGTSESRCDVPVIIEDFFPSILELARIHNPRTKQRIDGQSFLPLLKPQASRAKYRERELYWNYPNLWGNVGPGIASTCSILKDGYKLIYYYESGRKELFHLPTDLGERLDLSSKLPTIVDQLSKRLGRYLRSVSAQRPTFRSSGRPCPWPDEVKHP